MAFQKRRKNYLTKLYLQTGSFKSSSVSLMAYKNGRETWSERLNIIWINSSWCSHEPYNDDYESFFLNAFLNSKTNRLGPIDKFACSLLIWSSQVIPFRWATSSVWPPKIRMAHSWSKIESKIKLTYDWSAIWILSRIVQLWPITVTLFWTRLSHFEAS